MPRSNRNKNKWGSFRKPLNTKHAKDNKWYKSFNWNLAAALSNKTSGGTKNSFYYLFYPHEGTQKIKRKNPFAQKGLEKSEKQIVDGLFKTLNLKIKEEL